MTLKLKAKVSNGGKLFAGLGAADIAQALSQQKKIEIDKDELKIWIEKGAQISATVKKLIDTK